MKRLAVLLLFLALSAHARDPAQVRAFRKENPCPATSKRVGACPGWVVDHGIPLCAGGADAQHNLFWQRRDQSLKKDADERRLCARLRKQDKQ
jgi:hypothetical protein